MITPSGRKVSEGEKEREREREKTLLIVALSSMIVHASRLDQFWKICHRAIFALFSGRKVELTEFLYQIATFLLMSH